LALSAVLAGSAAFAWVGGTGAAALGSTGPVDAVGAACGGCSGCHARSMAAQPVVSSTPTKAPIRPDAVNDSVARRNAGNWIHEGDNVWLRLKLVEFIQGGDASCSAMGRHVLQEGRNSIQAE
jgi:hypothetical protein